MSYQVTMPSPPMMPPTRPDGVGGQASGLGHPLVEGQLRQIILALTGPEARTRPRGLPGRLVQRRTAGRHSPGLRGQAAVVLDVHRPVAATAGRGYEKVGFTH